MVDYKEQSKELPKLEFDKKRSRVSNCPCGKNNKDGKFSPYIGYSDRGHCHSCGNTFLPDLLSKSFHQNKYPPINPKAEKPPLHTHLPVQIFKGSLNKYEENNFVKFINGLLGKEKTNDLIEKYFIGSSLHWPGSTVFYQIDLKGNIRGGKIMLYNTLTGKRVKEPFNHITWVQSVLKLPGFNLRQCLFGEHLLQDKNKPIALVESEKTAIIADVYFPQFTWVATGGKGNLNIKQCQSLKGRTVTIFPDVNGYREWSKRAKELTHLATFFVSDFLERNANDMDREEGLDLADYLIKFPIEEFSRVSEEGVLKKPSNSDTRTTLATKDQDRNTLSRISKIPLSEDWYHSPIKPGAWNKEIKELEVFYSNHSLPREPVVLYRWQTITNLPGFISCHLETVKAQNGNPTYQPYLNRLMDLKKKLSTQL